VHLRVEIFSEVISRISFKGEEWERENGGWKIGREMEKRKELEAGRGEENRGEGTDRGNSPNFKTLTGPLLI
jgi:hypothetical protein